MNEEVKPTSLQINLVMSSTRRNRRGGLYVGTTTRRADEEVDGGDRRGKPDEEVPTYNPTMRFRRGDKAWESISLVVLDPWMNITFQSCVSLA